MSVPPSNGLLQEVHDLTLACLSDDATSGDVRRLEELLEYNRDARRIYARIIHDSFRLHRWAAADAAPADEAFGLCVELPLATCIEDELDEEMSCNAGLERDSRCDKPNGGFDRVSVSNGIPYLSYVASGWPIAYLIATVVVAIGIAIAAVTHVSSPLQVVQSSISVPSNRSPLSCVVGRITATADCVWLDSGGGFQSSGENSQKDLKSPVSLGDRLTIQSGLVEITYNTGAKVILQGPVSYEVESKNGGFMSVGKLTGKVETETARGLTIRTPTATVTDLGTEFGVEVGANGDARCQVFNGCVEVQSTVIKNQKALPSLRLRAGDTALVQSGHAAHLAPKETSDARFVRQIPMKRDEQIKKFDLVDVVAGGNGYSGKRGVGIDPTNGRSVTECPFRTFHGDGRYHRVEGRQLIDGVFIPRGHEEGDQVDSAGHVFTEFLDTDAFSSGCIWAGRGTSCPPPYPHRLALQGIDCGSPDAGFLFMHANKGITFDLKAIRQANSGWTPRRFLAVAGISEGDAATASKSLPKGDEDTENGLADVWVLVDGRCRYRFRQLNSGVDALKIAVALRDADRFLSLVATDGGNGIYFDCVVFGNPRLELVPNQAGAANKSGASP